MRLKSGFRNQRLTMASVIAAALCFCASTIADEGTIGIPKAVPFAATADVPEAVKNECQLGEKVSAYLEQFASNVKVSDQHKEGRYIDMTITEVVGSGGGAWSGPKWMEVTGTLKDNDKAVASFRAKRFSTGGAFGALKGTCSIMERCTKTIAKDISIWLQAPVDNAELGDAR